MKGWLLKQGIKTHIVVLAFFDYLSDTHHNLNFPKEKEKSWYLVITSVLRIYSH